MDTPDQKEYQDVCSTIIPGLVYLSGHRVANDLEKLQELSIRHVVRIGDKQDLLVYDTHPDIEYYTIEIKDSVRSHFTPSMLHEVIEFITSATTPVLIHCLAGVSRSATVAMAYLIKVHKKSYLEARNEVQEKRPCVSPNTTFLKDLQLFASTTKYQND